MRISICTYNDGLFEVMFEGENGEAITFEGNQKLSKEDLKFVNEIAPACVYTTYNRAE